MTSDTVHPNGHADGLGSARGGRLLVVEDDDSIADPLVEGLTREGYAVTRAATGAEALAAGGADLVLLDLGLPDLDGREVCRRLRQRSGVPIIVVSARADEVDRVLLLEIGADDYVVKPFGFRELVARIRAVRRRTGDRSPAGSRQALGPLVLDRPARRVWLGDAEVDLTPKEYDLLAYLAEEPSQVRTREDIIARVWDENWWGPTKTLDVHVAALRRKLRGRGDHEWITTLRGVGYRLDPPG
ncbi:MAG TPA: response regulator transcription factor [Acidimicrobiales bacterium]|nr:response regulator transcription factor [Acidimicrobiales bacterium]